MNDSSVIVSLLESYLEDRTVPLERLLTYYPPLESQNSKGKKVTDYPNKYFIMFGERKTQKSNEYLALVLMFCFNFVCTVETH